MGYTLEGEREQWVQLSSTQWAFVLKLAQDHGWKPMGTEAPGWTDKDGNPVADYSDWDGGYDWNEGQWVSEQDAANLATALEQALSSANSPIPRNCETVRSVVMKVITIARSGMFSIH
ncbi:hypothetical protein HQ590_04635 [bacterium]|nr:hypothetical protein [bacterium]